MRFAVLPGPLAVCRLAPGAEPPARPDGAELFSLTWTADELSVVCPQERATGDAQRGFRALVVEGPLPFDAVGIAAAFSAVLAGEGIPILPLATYDTDYVLVPGDRLGDAIAALRDAGHEVRA